MPDLAALRESGKNAFKNKSYDEAVKIYSEALKLDKDSPIWYSNRAMAYTKLEKWSQSLTDCNRGLSLHPEGKIMVKLLWRKGVSLINLSQFEEAKQSLMQAKLMDPDNSAIMKSLRTLQARENDLIKIEIQEVDHLPGDLLKFEKNTSSSSGKIPSDDSLEEELCKIDGVTVPSVKRIKPIESRPSSSERKKKNDPFTDTAMYPPQPSVYFLSTLKTKFTDENKHTYYLYILHLDSSIYGSIYKIAGVDSGFLQLYVDAALWYFKTSNDGLYNKKIADTIRTFTSLPRFMLSSMYLSSDKSRQLLDEIQSKAGSDLHSLW